MGICIVLILVIVSFIYNIAKKNRIKLNILMALIPIILISISSFYNYNQTRNECETVINIINFITLILALIVTIIAILYITKSRKEKKATKSILLIGVVLIFIGILISIAQPTPVVLATTVMHFTDEYVEPIGDFELYMKNISIELLFLLETNLFVSLISNNQKEEKNGK